MTVKLFRDGTYELKDTKEIVKLYESADGSFWYWKDYNSDNRQIITVTPQDFTRQVYIGRGGKDELEIGDLVVYLTGGYNSAPSMRIGQVVGFKNTRVTVNLECQCGTSNIAPNNLLLITGKKLRDKYNWIK
jgi:hypothetical protein